MEEKNDFKKWMEDCGFNGKQVTAAGEAIGVGQSMATRLSRGLTELTNLERMAMSASILGLEPWHPGMTEGIRSMKTSLEAKAKAED